MKYIRNNSVRDTIPSPLENSIQRYVHYSVRWSVWISLRSSIWDSVAASVWIPVRDQEENIWESMFWDQLEAKRIKHEIHR